MQSPYEKFEYQKILERVSSFAKTEQGKKALLSSKAFQEEKGLSREIDVLEETRMLLIRFGRLPIEVSSDLSGPISLAKKGGTLNVTDLERVASDCSTVLAIKRYFAKATDSPLLTEKANALPSLPYLEKAIHSIIAPDLSIYDGASTKLKGIRAAKRRLEASMKKKLGDIVSLNRDYLSDATLSLKNGHYVLPVNNAYKRKVKGIVQDVSSSGETTFIEPEVIVTMNNQMMELLNEERCEINRLLFELSSLVSANSEELSAMNAGIGDFDVYMAKCDYLESIHGTFAHLVSEPCLEFLEARHPLIDPSKVVPNDFHLDEKNRVVVLSGPNAGGKTVALKTLGLLLLLSESALPIPAKEGACFSFFHHVYVDIGDNQSLSDNLSTFSAHMKALSEILMSLGGKDLVLIDELGTGTSPKEGEALALSVLSYIRKKHAFALVSSHFEGLKAFALSTEGVQNASMLFDKEKLLPTYRLKMGLPGESYGLILARRFALPKEIIEQSEAALESKEDLSVSLAIEKLSSAVKENEDLKERLLTKEKDLEKERLLLQSKEASLLLKEKKFKEDVDIEKKKLLDEYEGKMKEILSEARQSEGKLHEVIKARKKLEDLQEKGPNAPSFSDPLKEGDYVAIPSLFVEGRLKELRGSKALVVSSEGMSWNVAKSLVQRAKEPKAEERRMSPSLGLHIDDLSSRKSVPLECNLIGMHLEEARLTLEKYLDDAILRHYKRVRIIHGWGSGVLRKMTLDYAKAHPDIIASSEGASGEEGGGGATILHLK